MLLRGLLVCALLAAASFRAGEIDFNNFVYPATPGQGADGPYAVRNGSYVSHATDVDMEVAPSAISTGDMRGDRSLQAAVLLTTSAPVGSTSILYIFDVRGRKAVLLRSFDVFGGAEGGLGIRFRIAGRFLYVELHAPDDPDQSVVTTYALRGSHLVQVYRMRHKPPTAF